MRFTNLAALSVLLMSGVLRGDDTIVVEIIQNHITHLENKNYKAIARALKVNLDSVVAAVNGVGDGVSLQFCQQTFVNFVQIGHSPRAPQNSDAHFTAPQKPETLVITTYAQLAPYEQHY